MEKLLLKVEEAARALGISRSKAYELVASGELPAVRVGNVIRVPAEALSRWVEGRPHAGGDPAAAAGQFS